VTGIGSNEEAVRRNGVDTNGVKMKVYVFSGLLAATAGMIPLDFGGNVVAIHLFYDRIAVPLKMAGLTWSTIKTRALA
jgi:ABC-type branched-subunit amino acid transport system permease subunit